MEDFGEAKEEWFKSFLELPNGIPSHDTFGRVFALLDPKQFQSAFSEWTESLRAAVDEEIVAMDGKALRRSVSKGGSPCSHGECVGCPEPAGARTGEGG